MRLLLRFLGFIVAIAFTLIVMVIGFLFWRLSQGPIDLDFLTPRIEAAVHELNPDLQVDVGTTQLLWNPRQRDIELSAVGVKLGSGEQSIAIPSVAVTLDGLQLLQGHVALSAIDLVEPSLRLVRDVDGHFALGIQGDRGGAAVLPLDSPAAIHMPEIGVRDGHFSIDDRGTGQLWNLDKVNVELRPSDKGIEGELRAEADLTPVLGPAPESAAASRTARLDVQAKLLDHANVLDVGAFNVDLQDVSLAGTVRLAGLREKPLIVKAQVKLARFAVDSLALYWPATAAAEARNWVTRNITGGQVRDAVFDIDASSAGGAFAVSNLQGLGAFEGLKVRFLDTMPPVTNVGGKATVSLDGATFQVARGQLLDIDVIQATVKLPAGTPPKIAIDAGVSGPLTSAFVVLDSRPVELTKAIGMQPRAGELSGRLGLAFVLRDGLTINDLGLTASGKMTGVAVDRVVGDMNATDAEIVISMRGPRLSLEGDGRLDDLPLHLELHDTIGTRGATRIAVKGNVDAQGWRKLGLDLGTRIDGPSRVTATVGLGDGVTIDANADLVNARLDLPGECLKKASGVPGKASARLRFRGGSLTAIERFSLAFAGTSVNANATRVAGSGWQAVSASGTFANPRTGGAPGKLSVDVAPGGSFTMSSRDAGGLLRAFGPADGQGGALSLHGNVSLNQPGLPFDGQLVVTNFLLTRSPLLARLFQLASIRGLLSSLSGEGIHFERIGAKLSHRGGAVEIEDGGARSPSVALTANGTLDFAADRLDLNGQVIPSYFGINEGIGKVPLLGDLFTGSKAKAVQAFHFTARGPLDNPQINVDTLSSLTPQVLQDLWRRLK